MGTVACRACKGSGRFYAKSGKAFDCRACGGTGVNKDLWSTRCERCRTEIIYKAGTNTPQFCKSCRDIDLEKPCAQMGCTNVIRYKVGWKNVSSYCKRCESKRQQGWSASTCPGTGMWGCGKLIWSPPGKRFTLCPDCSAKQKVERESKKRTKPCKHCGTTITYYVGGKEFDYCKSCNQLQEKACATPTCHNKVQYKVWWDNKPNFCEGCRAKQKQARDNHNKRVSYQEEKVGADTSLPGMGHSASHFGGGQATIRHYSNGYKHVTVWSGKLGEGRGSERYSWDVDPDGNYIPPSSHRTEQW